MLECAMLGAFTVPVLSTKALHKNAQIEKAKTIIDS